MLRFDFKIRSEPEAVALKFPPMDMSVEVPVAVSSKSPTLVIAPVVVTVGQVIATLPAELIVPALLVKVPAQV